MEPETPEEIMFRLTQQFEDKFTQAQTAMAAEVESRVNEMSAELDSRVQITADHFTATIASQANIATSSSTRAQLRKPPAFSGAKRENVVLQTLYFLCRMTLRAPSIA